MLLRLRHSVEAWARHNYGGIAMIAAVALPVLLAVLGVASDFAMLTKLRSDLQTAADAAAIAGAREIPVAKSNEKQVVSAAMSYATYALAGGSQESKSDLAASHIAVTAEVVDNFSAVSVDITETWSPFFAHFIKSGITPVKVNAKARFVGRNNICVLGLAVANTAVFLDKNAKLTANNCGVFANSKSSDALTMGTGAYMKTSIACSSGGASISGSATADPFPITDCPAVSDPLAARPAPPVGACDHNDLSIKGGTASLDPGVYCGGISIARTAIVTFNPGVYIIQDGGLTVAGSASISGDGVGFYLTGGAAEKFHFTNNTHISLTAPRDGPMAGLLFFEDRNLPVQLKHRITSNDARVLLGTIYLPVGGLVVDAAKPVADQSAYTAIIVQSLELNAGPNLVLNSDYGSSDVPVPVGVSGSSQVVLSN